MTSHRGNAGDGPQVDWSEKPLTPGGVELLYAHAELQRANDEVKRATKTYDAAGDRLRAAVNARLAAGWWLALSMIGWALMAAYYHDRLKGCVCP